MLIWQAEIAELTFTHNIADINNSNYWQQQFELLISVIMNKCHVQDLAVYSAFESTLNSSIVSYRIVS